VAAELEALEAALAGRSDADPELTALVRDVRADAPAPRPAFLADLDARVDAGFPRADRFGRLAAALPGGSRSRIRFLAPAAGLAATVLAGIAVVGLTGGGTDGTPTSSKNARDTTAELAKPTAPAPDALQVAPKTATGGGAAAGAAPTAPAPQDRGTSSATPAPPAAFNAPPTQRARKVERTTRLELSTPAAKLQSVVDRVVAVTLEAGGIVQQSQVDATDAGGAASFVLRVPSRDLDATVKRLSALAHVSSLSQSANDITDVFVSAQDRLGDARRERAALLRALGRATTASEIASLKARLRDNRSEIARAKGDLDAARRRSDLATVQVNVIGRGKEHGTGGGGGTWSPGDAARDALRVLEVAAGVLLVGGAVMVPLAVLGALAALAARGVRRRRREQALGAT
jgi:hypothetical protein